MLLSLMFMCWYGAVVGSPDIPTDIHRGSSLDINKAPYQVSIQHKSENNHVCGGSIISPHLVLTAAHCSFAYDKPENYQIRVGSSYWNMKGSVHQVVKIFVHEDYDENALVNDVAVYKVEPAFRINNSSIKIVDLIGSGEHLEADREGLVSGWGYTEDGKTPEHLMGLKVNIVNKKICHNNYVDFGGIGEGQICATSPKAGSDFCEGDSGGPLVFGGRLAGLVSYSGPECAEKGRPGVYTEVAYFRDWIDKRIKEDKETQ